MRVCECMSILYFQFYVYITIYMCVCVCVLCTTDDYIIIIIAVGVVLDGRAGDISRMLSYTTNINKYSLYTRHFANK